jgi:cobalt-zinc-cadmium efflux system outer membrane protein
LWPNPAVGYQGEQIRGGSFHGGEQGAFVQQDIVLGGKLGLRRNVFEQQRKADETGVEEQKLSVRGAVQIHFYSALAQLRIVDVQRRLLGTATDAATTAHQLANVGQADAPDVLQAEVEAEQAKLEFVRAQREYIQSYEQLAAVSGSPQMPLALLEGNLQESPAVDANLYIQDLLANSPTLKRAQQEADRAEAELARNKREAIPDLSLRVGAQQNREINDLSLRPVGAQGFATASIRLPIFDRNQGTVDASKADVERESAEVERIRLQLIQTAEPLLHQYLASKEEVERYQMQLIPRAQRAYELYLQKYSNMAAAYPQVIVSQRTLFQLEQSYVRTLGRLWSSAIQLQNYLLADGLSAPTSIGIRITQNNAPNSAGGRD